MTNTERHPLEKLLADVAGVEVRYPGAWGISSDDEVWLWKPDKPNGLSGVYQLWSPLSKEIWGPAQLNLVKAGLRRAEVDLVYVNVKNDHWWDLMPARKPGKFSAKAESESLALALAIQQWKEQTDGHSDSTKSV